MSQKKGFLHSVFKKQHVDIILIPHNKVAKHLQYRWINILK